MSEINLPIVQKYGSRELRNGDWLISFVVDKAYSNSVLPLHPIGQEAQLQLTIRDTGEESPVDERQQHMKKIYACAKDLGYDESTRRECYDHLTGNIHLTDMTLPQIEMVAEYFQSEAKIAKEHENLHD